MVKRVVAGTALVFLGVALSGCATGRARSGAQLQECRNQVASLQSESQSKDEEIAGLREALSRNQTAFETPAGNAGVLMGVKSRPTIRQVQTALRNAGYNPGGIDGKMGRQTREAIRAFQRAYDLKADGRVGRRTWEKLRPYLEQKVK